MLKNRFAILIASPLLCQLACGDPAQPPLDPLDMSTPPDMSPSPDLAELLPRCELPFDVRAIDKTSTGVVTIGASPSDPMVWNAEVDATAGGASKYGENPFVYLDLVTRKKVEISDAQAEKSKDWDIAFKRWQIKINSGDSGPGYVLLARVDAANLSDVTDAPTGPYQVDAYFDAKCNFISDPIGGLSSALSDWYEYDMSMGGTRLVPRKQILVLTRRDGMGSIKLQLTSYYKGTVSGNFSMSWSYLP